MILPYPLLITSSIFFLWIPSLPFPPFLFSDSPPSVPYELGLNVFLFKLQFRSLKWEEYVNNKRRLSGRDHRTSVFTLRLGSIYHGCLSSTRFTCFDQTTIPSFHERKTPTENSKILENTNGEFENSFPPFSFPSLFSLFFISSFLSSPHTRNTSLKRLSSGLKRGSVSYCCESSSNSVESRHGCSTEVGEGL